MDIKVASFTDAWIETVMLMLTSVISRSHLLQMRGLKQTRQEVVILHGVASFTDAWIETPRFIRLPLTIESHLLQMRGLKLLSPLVFLSMICRIFYRCVD